MAIRAKTTPVKVVKKYKSTSTIVKKRKGVSTLVKKRVRTSTISKRSDYKKRGTHLRQVWTGRKKKTSGGLTKSCLMMNKRGRIVSKRLHCRGLKLYYENNIDLWTSSFMNARQVCGIAGFCPVKKAGTAQEKNLYKTALEGFVEKNVGRLNTKLVAAGLSSRAAAEPRPDTSSPANNVEPTDATAVVTAQPQAVSCRPRSPVADDAL